MQRSDMHEFRTDNLLNNITNNLTKSISSLYLVWKGLSQVLQGASWLLSLGSSTSHPAHTEEAQASIDDRERESNEEDPVEDEEENPDE
jgi:hypothetical protein